MTARFVVGSNRVSLEVEKMTIEGHLRTNKENE